MYRYTMHLSCTHLTKHAAGRAAAHAGRLADGLHLLADLRVHGEELGDATEG